MTTVDLLFSYRIAPSQTVIEALASTRDVYGIRSLEFDRVALTLRVEYDATRLNAATVTKLIRQTGLEISEELSLIPTQPEPVPAAS
jgi:hypothetical protein